MVDKMDTRIYCLAISHTACREDMEVSVDRVADREADTAVAGKEVAEVLDSIYYQ